MWRIKGRLQNENLRQVSDSVKQRLSWRAQARQSLRCESGYCKETEKGGVGRQGWTGREKNKGGTK